MMSKHKKLIEYLVSYKKLKSRLKAIKVQLEYEDNKQLIQEKEEKERIVRLIEAGLEALDEDELALIEAKYLQGRVKRDNLIYDSRVFPYSSSQYYRVKKRVLKKLGEGIGDLL